MKRQEQTRELNVLSVLFERKRRLHSCMCKIIELLGNWLHFYSSPSNNELTGVQCITMYLCESQHYSGCPCARFTKCTALTFRTKRVWACPSWKTLPVELPVSNETKVEHSQQGTTFSLYGTLSLVTSQPSLLDFE